MKRSNLVSFVATFALAFTWVGCGGSKEQPRSPRSQTSSTAVDITKAPKSLEKKDEESFNAFLKNFSDQDDTYAPENQLQYASEEKQFGLVGQWCATHPSSCYVEYAYKTLLGRTSFGDQGRWYWVKALNEGRLNRGQVWYLIRHSEEGCARRGC